MEESTSTELDAVDVITGKYVEVMKPLTSYQYACLIFEAIRLIKRQLRYVSQFEHLPEMTAKLASAPSYSWVRLLAEYRQAMIDHGVDKQFGLSNRVIELCRLETSTQGPVSEFRIYLTQKGELRVVKEWKVSKLFEEPEKFMVVHQIKSPEQLSALLDTEGLKIERCLGSIEDPRRNEHYFSHLGQWLLFCLMTSIERQEDQIRQNLKSFSVNRQSLSQWLEVTKISSSR